MQQGYASPPPETTLEGMFNTLAKSDDDKFLHFFRRFRSEYPEQATRACVAYLGSNESDASGRRMAIWLSAGEDYIRALVDPELLTLGAVRKATFHLLKVDARFWVKVSNLTSYKSSNSSELLARSLALIEGFDNLPVLVPFLRALTSHPNKEICSKSVKILSRTIASRAFAERQLQSDDPRVRANAIEGRWGMDNLETKQIYEKALSDSHHRVVANALVGLYLQHDESALPKMIDFAQHPEPNFRAAMAWAFGYIHDWRARSALEVLVTDVSPMVRKRAGDALTHLQPEPVQVIEERTNQAQAVAIGDDQESRADAEPGTITEFASPKFSLV